MFYGSRFGIDGIYASGIKSTAITRTEVWVWRARAATSHSDIRFEVCHDFCTKSLNLCVNLLNFCVFLRCLPLRQTKDRTRPTGGKPGPTAHGGSPFGEMPRIFEKQHFHFTRRSRSVILVSRLGKWVGSILQLSAPLSWLWKSGRQSSSSPKLEIEIT